ncbi:MAG: CRISPR-associated ring nuclease Csm6 [Cyclonatronaceae bacterium]
MKENHDAVTLIATIGTTPAVLTEAIYALYTGYKQKIATIIILTTQAGKMKLDEELFDAGNGALGRLYRALNLGMDEYPQIKTIIPEFEGRKLADIRNKAEDEVFASALLGILRNCTQDTEIPVYGLLSGGRKTMSAHMHSAFQLMARPKDKLIHVLVQPRYEIPGFYFPEAQNEDKATGDAAETLPAVIEVVESPFIPLRNLVKPPLDFNKPFSELVETAHKRLAGNQYPVRSLFIDLDKRVIYLNDYEKPVSIPPRPLSLLSFFAYLNAENDTIYPLSYRNLVSDNRMLEILKLFYARITRNDMEQDAWFGRGKSGMPIQNDTNLFARSRNELVKKLHEGLKKAGYEDVSGSEVFFNDRVANKDNAAVSNKLMIPGAVITFNDEHFLRDINSVYTNFGQEG